MSFRLKYLKIMLRSELDIYITGSLVAADWSIILRAHFKVICLYMRIWLHFKLYRLLRYALTRLF